MGSNDGMNCHNGKLPTPAPTPFPTPHPTPAPTPAPTKDEPQPFYCDDKDQNVLFQNVYDKRVGLEIKYLEYETGNYIPDFTITTLKNACDISPVSYYAYCLGDVGGATYIARFGQDQETR